jgi:hypothetical protein
MSSSDLKLDLIKHISASENLNLLKEIKRLLSLETNDQDVYKFSPDQLQRVNESLEQYKQGRIMTQEEAEIDIQKWLKEEEK